MFETPKILILELPTWTRGLQESAQYESILAQCWEWEKDSPGFKPRSLAVLSKSHTTRPTILVFIRGCKSTVIYPPFSSFSENGII